MKVTISYVSHIIIDAQYAKDVYEKFNDIDFDTILACSDKETYDTFFDGVISVKDESGKNIHNWSNHIKRLNVKKVIGEEVVLSEDEKALLARLNRHDDQLKTLDNVKEELKNADFGSKDFGAIIKKQNLARNAVHQSESYISSVISLLGGITSEAVVRVFNIFKNSHGYESLYSESNLVGSTIQ